MIRNLKPLEFNLLGCFDDPWQITYKRFWLRKYGYFLDYIDVPFYGLILTDPKYPNVFSLHKVYVTTGKKDYWLLLNYDKLTKWIEEDYIEPLPDNLIIV